MFLLVSYGVLLNIAGEKFPFSLKKFSKNRFFPNVRCQPFNVQLLTIEAAATKKKEHIYQAAMLDPHTGSELDIDTIKKMVDDLIEAHGNYLPKYQ